MPSKKRRSFIDELFGGSIFDDFEKLFEEGIEGSGYSISVTQTPEGTKIYAKVGKDTDVNALRRQLEQQYPGAEIEIEGGRPLIREISTKSIEDDEESESGKN